jgi:hypothetical protein
MFDSLYFLTDNVIEDVDGTPELVSHKIIMAFWALGEPFSPAFHADSASRVPNTNRVT